VLTVRALHHRNLSGITEINFTAFPTYEALIEEQGQFHGIARVAEYRLEDTMEDRFTAHQYTLPQYTALFMETDDNLLTKRNIRLGILKAIDKQAILEAIGYDQAIDTPLLELNQEDWINQYNPVEAGGAFFDEGWAMSEEKGIRMNEEGDASLNFILVRRSYPNNEKQEEITKTTAELIAAQLAEVGVVVTVESYEEEAFQEKVANRDYDLLLYGQSLGYNLDTYSYWHSSQSGTGLNLSNYGNNKADFYIEAIRNTFDDETETRQEYLEILATVINNDIPAVFLYTPTYYFLTDSRIQNVSTENLLFPQDRFANILDWQIAD
jgi:peptide/nickel transport system substrate-binding protein